MPGEDQNASNLIRLLIQGGAGPPLIDKLTGNVTEFPIMPTMSLTSRILPTKRPRVNRARDCNPSIRRPAS